MASVDATSFDAALKENYTEEGVNDVTYPDNPFWGICPKKMNQGGKRYIQPIQYGIPAGRSRTFSTAQANKNTNVYEDFFVTYQDNFAAISISRKVMLQSSGGGKMAFFEARKREVDGMLNKLTRSEAISMYRGTGGSIGQINSSYSSGTSFTLAEVEDVCNFELNDVLVFDDQDGNTSTDVLDSATTATVTAIDRDAGTITVNTATPLAASRYVFIEGDWQASIAGLLGWIPTTAPSAGDSWFGVDRSDDTRLSGSRLDVSTVSIAEGIQQGASRLGREGAAPDLFLCSHLKFRDLVLELGNKVVYDDMKSTDARIGFKAVSVVGPRGPIKVVADQNCPDAYGFLLTKSSWNFVALNPTLPDLVSDDGVTMLREVTSAGYEVRADIYGNLACSDPRANCVLTLE